MKVHDVIFDTAFQVFTHASWQWLVHTWRLQGELVTGFDYRSKCENT